MFAHIKTHTPAYAHTQICHTCVFPTLLYLVGSPLSAVLTVRNILRGTVLGRTLCAMRNR